MKNNEKQLKNLKTTKKNNEKPTKNKEKAMKIMKKQ